MLFIYGKNCPKVSNLMFIPAGERGGQCLDFIGFLPTFRKSYEEPYSETEMTFLLSAIANITSLIALQNYSITTVLYILSLIITNTTLVIIVKTRKKVLPKPA